MRRRWRSKWLRDRWLWWILTNWSRNVRFLGINRLRDGALLSINFSLRLILFFTALFLRVVAVDGVRIEWQWVDDVRGLLNCLVINGSLLNLVIHVGIDVKWVSELRFYMNAREYIWVWFCFWSFFTDTYYISNI